MNKCIGDLNSIVALESVDVKKSLSYEEYLLDILDRQICKLRNR